VAAKTKRPHILVIDDDADMAHMLEVSLKLYGYEVSTALNGEDGLREAKKIKPDLVILDVMMPGKNGLEVMYAMRRGPKTRDIPILFLSALGDEPTVVQGLKGAEDYVRKPFKPLELLARIENIIERAGEKAGTRRLEKEGGFDRLAIQRGTETTFASLESVCFLEANGRYCFAHTRNGKFLVNYSVGELEERLDGRSEFLRIHRSHILNIDYIHKGIKDERNRLVFIIDDESQSRLTVSATYFPQVESRLGL
jgi:CheY-like chemotaxis protein